MKFEKFKPENYKNVDIKFTLRLPDVNDNIRMYKKSNLKMYKNVHS